MTMDKIDRLDFDNLTMEFPNNVLIFGPTQSGKSTIVKKILIKHNNNFDYIFGFGKNLKTFSSVARMTYFEELDIQLIREIWETNKMLEEDDKEMKNILIVFDDVLGEDFHHGDDGDFWKEFISTCRHQQISCIFSIQHMTAINPAMRKNLLYIFVTDIDNETIDKVKPYTKLKTKDILDIELEGYEALFISRRKTQKMLAIINE